MAIEKVPMTKEGHKALNDELTERKTIERPRIIEAIAEARAHGDLSENAEYHSAKEAQGMNEAKIKELESQLSRADIIDVAAIKETRIVFGATVLLMDLDTDKEVTYKIVGDYEADVKAGKISISSPIARQLIGKSAENFVDVKTPGGEKSYEILSVNYK